MRRRAARHEAHFAELRPFHDFLGEPQMPVVDRIEGAAEDADRAD
jgi:hypothetical protein